MALCAFVAKDVTAWNQNSDFASLGQDKRASVTVPSLSTIEKVFRIINIVLFIGKHNTSIRIATVAIPKRGCN
jgi:hypothetical protein